MTVQEEDDFIDPWCATAVNSAGEYIGQWAECNAECPVCETKDHSKLCSKRAELSIQRVQTTLTLSDHACDFPFKYNGHYQHVCVERAGVSSCAVEKDSSMEVTVGAPITITFSTIRYNALSLIMV